MKSAPIQIEFTVHANTAYGLYEQAIAHLGQLFEISPLPRDPMDLERFGCLMFLMRVSEFAKSVDGKVRMWQGDVKVDWRQP